MRVVQFLDQIRLADGGVVRSTLDLCGALPGIGHEVVLVTCDATDAPAAWKAGGPGVPSVVLLPPRRGPLLLLTPEARAQLRRAIEAADVVHIHEFWHPASVQAAAIARKAGKPYIISTHGMLDEWSMARSRLKKRVHMVVAGSRMFRGAAAFHCTAEGERRQADRWLPPGKSRVVPYVMDLSPYEQASLDAAGESEWAGGNRDPIVLFLSRIHEKKGIEHLIGAAAMLRDSGKRFRVLVAGTGEQEYQERLRTMVRERGLEGVVEFVGLVVGARKLALMRAADMLVLPTYQENFGLVLVEAMACGTTVVTTRGVDIWPELESSGAATVIDSPGDEAVAEAVAGLLDDPERCAAMGRAGRMWVFEKLGAGVPERFGAMYEEARAARPGA